MHNCLRLWRKCTSATCVQPYPFIYLSIIYLSIHLFIHYLPIPSPTNPFIYSSIHLFIHNLPIPSPTNPFIYLSIIYQSIHLPTHSSKTNNCSKMLCIIYCLDFESMNGLIYTYTSITIIAKYTIITTYIPLISLLDNSRIKNL